MPSILYDHRFYPADALLIGGASRGLRYGDGLFETMKVREGVLLLAPLHFARLWKGFEVLRFTVPYTPASLEAEVLDLCVRNGHTGLGRVRLNIFRGGGGVNEPLSMAPHCLIESFSLVVASDVPTGLDIDVFPDGRKAQDAFSNLKTNNYLLYLMGAAWARERGLGECLVLNAHGRVADASISNVFWVSSGQVCTPPLSEGGVAGVTRRFLLENLSIEERPLEVSDLLAADEVFLTNAITEIRWVRRFGEKTYGHAVSDQIAHKLFIH